MAEKQLSRILLVEDALDVQLVARMALEKMGGLTVEACSSGQEALEKAPEFAPDLILLDVMMPGMDGPTTLRRLRDHPATADIPVIFMTAKLNSADAGAYTDMGALDIILKPFNPVTLADTVTEIWRRSRS